MTSLAAQKIAVIGAGPCGLAVAKYLLAEKCFPTIDIFEQRSVTGGLWNYTPKGAGDERLQVSRVDSNHVEYPLRPVVQQVGLGQGEPVFPSPIYASLETNIPAPLMRFSDLEFPPNTSLFPRHEVVRAYIQSYGRDVEHLIRLNTQVRDVRLLRSETVGDSRVQEQWAIQTENVISGEQCLGTYDAVVVASGHYDVPFIPNIDGMRDWVEAYPKAISHSKFYRTAADFKGKKVVLVGNSASGLDIGNQIAPVCLKPLLVSQKSTSPLFPDVSPLKKFLPPISSLLTKDRSLRFEDGHVESDVDLILFCTGYLYSYPFLSTLKPEVVIDGARVENTYKHLFYFPHPTLTFIALPQKVIPFPLSEVQAAVVARIYSGRLRLPKLAVMQAWEEEVRREKGATRQFHVFAFPKDIEYVNEMWNWADKAEETKDLEGCGRGKLGERWGEWHLWIREQNPAIRKAFVERGELRHMMTRPEQLGFSLDI